MLQIAICDDIQEHADLLLSLLKQQVGALFEADIFDSPDALLAALRENRCYDVFFLDVELGEESGVALAKTLNGLMPAAQIIFVTANIMNAVKVSEANHIYFLTKPVEPDKLKSAFLRAVSMLRAQVDKRISVPLRGGGTALLSSGKIIYCERIKRMTAVHCADGVSETPLSLAHLEESLPSLLFARPHNSFLVNLMHVQKSDWQHVYLDGGAVLSISNQRRDGFKDALAAYVAR